MAFTAHILRTRQPLMINTDLAERAREFGSFVVVGEAAKCYLGVPLIVGDEARGLISLQNTERENAFTESDQRLLTTLASSLSVAFENARLFAEIKRRAGELAALTDIGREISASLDLPTVLARISTSARDLLAGRQQRRLPAGARRPDPDAHRGGRRRSRRHPADPLADGRGPDRPYHPGRPARDRARRGQRPARHPDRRHPAGGRGADDAGAAPGRRPHHRRHGGLARVAAVAVRPARSRLPHRPGPPGGHRHPERAPVRAGPEPGQRDRRPQPDRPRNFGHARPDHRAGAHRPICPPPAGGRHQRRVPAGARRPDPARAGGPGRYRRAGARHSQVTLGTGIIGSIARNGMGEYVNNTAADSRAVHIAGTDEDDDGQKLMAVPLLAKDGLLGAMAIWRGAADPAFGETDLDFLDGLARQAAIAIQNARLFAEIQRQKDYAGALVENSPVAIVTTDLDTNVVSWNPGAEKLFGYTPEEAIGRSLDDLIGARHRPARRVAGHQRADHPGRASTSSRAATAATARWWTWSCRACR